MLPPPAYQAHASSAWGDASPSHRCHLAPAALPGLALELASPLLPGAFLLLACLGSVARAITGMAGGATRMALTQHFALQRNAADIAAKEGSQVGCRCIAAPCCARLHLHWASRADAPLHACPPAHIHAPVAHRRRQP